jgi:hypothetical protein
MGFDRYIGIDYSGEGTPDQRLPGLAVFQAYPNGLPTKVNPAGHERWNWTRREMADWLKNQLESNVRSIVGIDHAFSFPTSYFRRFGLRTWDQFLEDFAARWPAHEKGQTVSGLKKGNKRLGDKAELRLTEKWTSSAKSVFRFGIPGQVATSSHAGIPWLKFFRDSMGDRVHFWPFDDFEVVGAKSVIVEVYPAILRNRYERDGRNEHEHDAYSIARWLSERDSHGLLDQYFTPQLTDEERAVGQLEGWIFGIL